MFSWLELHLYFTKTLLRATATMEAQVGGARKPVLRWTQKVALESHVFEVGSMQAPRRLDGPME